jgi:Concanavalin A-like lectin/glucanases superfamily
MFTTDSTFSASGMDIFSDHALLGKPTGVKSAIIIKNPDCYPPQANPIVSRNTVYNLVPSANGGFVGFYAGDANSITNAPTFSSGRFEYTKANGNILTAINSTDYEIGNQSTLVTAWLRVKTTYQEATLFLKGSLTPPTTSYTLIITPNNANLFWTFQGDSGYTSLQPASGTWSLANDSLHQIGFAFVPNGANSTMFLIIDGGVAAQQTFTGKNAIQATNNKFIIGNTNGANSLDGFLYGLAFENCTISGNDPLERARLEYQQMSEFFASY